ncbi:cyclic nucleotide-binding domain-containing protein [Apiospora arundinis]
MRRNRRHALGSPGPHAIISAVHVGPGRVPRGHRQAPKAPGPLAHDHVLTEGDEAKAMYWLVRGVVAVTSRDGEAIHAELKPGAFFGEIGVLMDMPRTATIIARTKCLLLVLKKEDLQLELPRFPDMEKAIRHEAHERLHHLK